MSDTALTDAVFAEICLHVIPELFAAKHVVAAAPGRCCLNPLPRNLLGCSIPEHLPVPVTHSSSAQKDKEGNCNAMVSNRSAKMSAVSITGKLPKSPELPTHGGACFISYVTMNSTFYYPFDAHSGLVCER